MICYYTLKPQTCKAMPVFENISLFYTKIRFWIFLHNRAQFDGYAPFSSRFVVRFVVKFCIFYTNIIIFMINYSQLFL